ncbi:MAG: DUF4342 domain-containing protein [Trueperaceae bacterium]
MTEPRTAEPTPEPAPEAAPEGERTAREEFRVSGEAVVAKVKELVREGNVRRIIIKNDDGRVLLEVPLTIGVIGTVLLPVWAALGAMAALVANLTLAVERVEPREPAAPAASSSAPPATATQPSPTHQSPTHQEEDRS